MIYNGDLTITKANAAKYGGLTEVKGYLSIYDDAKLEAPALRKLAGHDLPDAATADRRIKAVAKRALASDDALNMNDWHTCETTHCIAGWGEFNEGKAGRKLADNVGHAAAGAILLGLEAAHYFHVSDETARTWLRSKVAA